MDTFARDHLPPREAWPDLLLLDGPSRVNAAVELLAHEGTAIAGGWSYAELHERASAIAASLEIEPGTRVLLHTPNTPEAVACWLGILLAGGIVVATMPLLRAREIAKVTAKGEVGVALVTRDLAGEVELGDVRIIEELPERGSFEPVDTAADDVAIIAFTSGTTGTPKGCVHFHRDLLASCDTFAKHVLDPRSTDVFSGTPPLAFTFGLGASLLFPLRFGAAAAPVARPGDMLDAIREYGITTLFTAPTAYRAMLRRRGPGVAAHVRLGRRAAARERGRGVAREDRHPHHRRDRLDRDAAHLHRLAGRRGRGPARAGGRCRAMRRGSSTTT